MADNILGTFTGECCDSQIVNKNGFRLGDTLWENLFKSEDYKQALKNGWYIGYLGHPEDPDCMDFKNACIVMTDCYKDKTGKLIGTFNLLDTPVGKIVKTFIDAGVTFGISIRGMGDQEGEDIDPDTFIFRGFDLVTFPAYEEAVPKFSAIAASTDRKARQRYEITCKTVKDNLNSISSLSTLSIIKNQFSRKSALYKDIQDSESKIRLSAHETRPIDIYIQKWLAASQELDTLKRKYERQIKCYQRIIDDQNKNVENLDLLYNNDVAKLQACIQKKDSQISKLKSKASETVEAARIQKSNSDKTISRISNQLNEFKTAYVELCESVTGKTISASIDAFNSTKDINRVLKGHYDASKSSEVPDLEIYEDDEIITI